MTVIEPFYSIFGIKPVNLPKDESLVLEAEFFLQIYSELIEISRNCKKNYFRLMKYNEERENEMLESSFLQEILKDLLSSEEYSLKGIAYYTQIPEDVLEEMLLGKNNNPSFQVAQRLIKIHRSSRTDLYQNILRKLFEKSKLLSEDTNLS